nr:ribonuclease H-like domain-containing protein [Tanacetum cinerariifolium]
MGISVSSNVVAVAASLFGCSNLTAPFNYLGVKVGSNMSRITSWDDVIFKNGGLGVSSFFAHNCALLFKWVWRFLTDGSSLWTRFIKTIFGNKGDLDTHKLIPKRSPRQDVILVIHSLQSKCINLMDFIQKKVGNGENTSFWDDSWLGEVALKVLYKRLYALEMCKSISMAEKMGHPSLSRSFRRMPKGGGEQKDYGLLCSKVADLVLPNISDRCIMDAPPSPNYVFNFREDEFEEDPHEEPEEEFEEDPEKDPEEELEVKAEDDVPPPATSPVGSPITPPPLSEFSSDTEDVAPIVANEALEMPPIGSLSEVGGPSYVSPFPSFYLHGREIARLDDNTELLLSNVKYLEQCGKKRKAEMEANSYEIRNVKKCMNEIGRHLGDEMQFSNLVENRVTKLEDKDLEKAEEMEKMKKHLGTLETNYALVLSDRGEWKKAFYNLQAWVSERFGRGAMDARLDDGVSGSAAFGESKPPKPPGLHSSSQKAVKKRVKKQIAEAIEEYENTRANPGNASGSGSTNTGGSVNMQGCTHKTFMNEKPHPFNGTEGVVGLRRWIEKVEQVFEICKCVKEDKGMFAASTFKGRDLTWWNRNVIEEELWTLTLKGDDIEAYNNRFHELALMCPDLVPNEKKKIKRYTKGFPERIKGNITSSRPTKLHDAINFTRELVEQAVQGKAARINEAIKGNGKNTRKTTPTTITPTTVTATATTTINTTNRTGGKKLPGPMPQLQLREKDYRVRIPAMGGNTLQDVTCFGIIAHMDADVDVTLKDAADIAKEVVVDAEIKESADVQGRQADLGDLYPVTKPSTLLVAFVSTSSTTWHQRLGHPEDEVLRSLSSHQSISCNKAKSTHVCHACQLVKNGTWILVPRPTDANLWPIHQLDVKNVFLNGDLSKAVYMHQPPGFVDSRYPNHGSQVAYLLIYVDDIILTASSSVLFQQIADSLHKEFDMTDFEALNYFLGISTVHHLTGLFLSQKKYALQLFERAHMANCNPSQTPADTDSKLGPDDVGCPSTRMSTSGYCVFLETAWIRNLLRELHSPLLIATLVYCDNVSAVYMSANPVQHQRTKHIDIDIHFVHDMVKAGHVRVLHVPSRF